MRKRLTGLAGVSAVTATLTLLALQWVSFGRGAPTVLLVLLGGWLFTRGAFLAGAGLFTAAEADDHKWRLWLVPLQVVLGFGALYAAIWRLDPGSLVGAGLEPPLARFSLFAATLGAAGHVSPEETIAQIALAGEVAAIAIVAGALVRRIRRPAGWAVGAAVLVAVGGTAIAITQERKLPGDFQRGVTLTGYARDEYAGDEAHAALRAAADRGAEWVAITPAWYQDKASSTKVGPDRERTPSTSSVEGIVRQARDLHLKVTLKPHLNLREGSYRGDIAPADLDAWFDSYGHMLDFYARLAQRTGVSQLVVGTELEGVSGHTERWRRLIARVRRRFGGKLTYAANSDEVRRVRFWDALDFIGVDAYYPLGKGTDADVAQVVEAWKEPVAQLEKVHQRWDRDVLFTEIGYPSAESALRTPYEEKGPQDLELQKTAVDAALTVWAERPWLKGMYWWEWTSEPSEVGEGDRSFALNGKPAADVIRDWYSD